MLVQYNVGGRGLRSQRHDTLMIQVRRISCIDNGPWRDLASMHSRHVLPRWPWCPHLCTLLLLLEGVQGVTIPIVRPLECFVRWYVRVDPGSLKEVGGVLHLWCKLVPQLDQKVNVHCAQVANEMIFEHLDGVFSCVDLMVAWLNELKMALL